MPTMLATNVFTGFRFLRSWARSRNVQVQGQAGRAENRKGDVTSTFRFALAYLNIATTGVAASGPTSCEAVTVDYDTNVRHFNKPAQNTMTGLVAATQKSNAAC